MQFMILTELWQRYVKFLMQYFQRLINLGVWALLLRIQELPVTACHRREHE